MADFMMGKRVGLASDHGAYELRQVVKDWLLAHGYAVTDYGSDSQESVDYPDHANLLAQGMTLSEVDWGVALCGTGIGMSLALNRHAHIRAALCDGETLARLARQHNDANLLVFGGRVTGPLVATSCLEVFTRTAFEGGRHARRVAKLG